MEIKKIIVVIVTYNGSNWIEKNIRSLKNSNYSNDIYIVDNMSTDNTIEIIESFDNITLIKNTENSGFGSANNIALRKIFDQFFDYVFLINQDAWVFEDTITKLVEVAESNHDFGIISPMHYSGDSINLDEKFKTYFERSTAEKITDKIVYVSFVNAAAWLVSKKCIQKVGFFEPLFKHYGEDNDYCRRLIYHKFKIVISKESKICHDRIIVRSITKDFLQSKLQILFEILNINHSLGVAYFFGFKSIFGSVNFYSKFYSKIILFKLLIVLLTYYVELLFLIFKLRKDRIDNSKNAK